MPVETAQAGWAKVACGLHPGRRRHRPRPRPRSTRRRRLLHRDEAVPHPRQAGRAWRCMPGRAAAPRWRTGCRAWPSARSGCRSRRIGWTWTPRAAWCWAAPSRRWPRSARFFAEGRAAKTYWAVVRGGPAARAGEVSAPLIKRSTRQGWLVDGGGPGRAAGGHRLAGAGPRAGGPGLAGTAPAHRADASDPGALRPSRLPDPGRCPLWRRGGAACSCWPAAITLPLDPPLSAPPPRRRRICGKRWRPAAGGP